MLPSESYSLLALFLSPWKGKPELNLLRDLSAAGPAWEELLFLAETDGVGPLWYSRLKQDRLTGSVPAAVLVRLRNLMHQSLIQSERQRQALARVLTGFRDRRLPVLLLKGAAALVDDLYGMPGVRVMGDFDLLVREEDLAEAGRVLGELGYVQVPDEAMAPDGLPTDRRHHHHPAYRLPGAHLVVELHYRSGYAQAGEAVTASELWRRPQWTGLAGVPAAVPAPVDRLILNTGHAMVPECEFIRGRVSLRQLAEFAFLARRYADRMDWRQWLAAGEAAGLRLQFLTLLALAERLMALPRPPEIGRSRRPAWHARRIAATCGLAARRRTGGTVRRSGDSLLALLADGWYYAHLPPWVWRNVCYTGNGGHRWQRVVFLLRKAASRRSRSRIGR